MVLTPQPPRKVPPRELARLVVTGRRLSIYDYVESTEPEVVPTRAFRDGLQPGAMARYGARFKALAEEGNLRGEQFKKVNDELFEFKDNTSQTRIFCFYDERETLILCYAFGGKKENKIPKYHINEGQKIKKRYLDRKSKIR